jgi:hypothetical protein
MSWFRKHKSNSHPFSDKTAKALQQAGWHSGREVNIEPWLNILSTQGFEVFPAVQEFLKGFGGLLIRYEFTYGRDVIGYQMHFNVEAVCNAEIQEDAAYFSQVVGTALCPVGRYDVDMILMMDKDGKTYGCQGDGYVFFLGNTPMTAIDHVIMHSDEITPFGAEPKDYQ